ncbi:insertion element protein [Alkalicoccus halolimnae]|uniref:Insertion element protein n=1 Tax=Alkalicoccus halolimnae TaxID=1667239 RepID=A0A5C7F8I5_9BACI|nr:insertion element protein [Alkalicoccus halolimnae]TXF86343.1 insertion element protein [Alkalicoccus halolimnae]
MAKLKRLATPDESIVHIEVPISSEEIKARNELYPLLTSKKFATKFKDSLFVPIDFKWKGQAYQVQYNFCTDPYCKWKGLHQEKFTSVKRKPNRYKLTGTGDRKALKCNPDPLNPKSGAVLGCSTQTYSNWSIVEEIARLAAIESLKDIDPDYEFHKGGCLTEEATPFNDSKTFYKRGKSKSNSQRYQCKNCKKFTNVLPSRKQSITYHQQKSDIVPTFAKLLLNRTPVTRTCEILDIGRGTYYQKLEWLYRRCLEFLERYEKAPLRQTSFEEMWLNTDKMTYYLNNVRRKGMGGKQYDDLEEARFPTSIVVTAEVFSRYVFRADVAYDWNIEIGDIALDTLLYKDDHLNHFAKKNARFPKYSDYPQPPAENDTQTNEEYFKKLSEVERRANYVEGLHVNSSYTSIAHFWHIKQLVNASEWRFITDQDDSITTAFFRVFSTEFRMSDAHHFLCQTDKTKSKKQAHDEFKLAQQYLITWGRRMGYDTRSLRKLALLQLEERFHTHQFHKEITTKSGTHKKYAANRMEHPLGTPDRGFRWVDCTTDLSAYEPNDIANMILHVNDNAINAFIQSIRRRLSILERPLTTARGDGKSYIYSNFNPRYAQMAVTILRTYYNFCLPYKSKTGRKTTVETPAQQLGITNKKFSLNDIIFMQ